LHLSQEGCGCRGLSRRRASVLGTRRMRCSFRGCGLRRAPAGATAARATAGLVAPSGDPEASGRRFWPRSGTRTSAAAGRAFLGCSKRRGRGSGAEERGSLLDVTPKLLSPAQSILAGREPEIERPMPIYPSDFWKRSEQKWKRRGEESGSTLRTPQTGKNRSGLAPQQDGDTILSRWPWLISIGQGLQSEYAAFKQPVEKRLVALLKKLRRSRAR